MITNYKVFEKYNNNKLNELIVKNFNDDSELIIEILDTYEKKSDAKDILEKISFIIESGDIETEYKDKKEYLYYIAVDDDRKTFIFNIEKENFYFKRLK
jgi:hypothetical protein